MRDTRRSESQINLNEALEQTQSHHQSEAQAGKLHLSVTNDSHFHSGSELGCEHSMLDTK